MAIPGHIIDFFAGKLILHTRNKKIYILAPVPLFLQQRILGLMNKYVRLLHLDLLGVSLLVVHLGPQTSDLLGELGVLVDLSGFSLTPIGRKKHNE